MRRREDNENGRMPVWPIIAHRQEGEKHGVSEIEFVGIVLLWGSTACQPSLDPAASQFTNRDDHYLVPPFLNSATGSDRSQTW